MDWQEEVEIMLNEEKCEKCSNNHTVMERIY